MTQPSSIPSSIDEEIEKLRRELLDAHDSRRPVIRLARRDIRNARNDLADWFIVTVVRNGKPMRCLARPVRAERSL